VTSSGDRTVRVWDARTGRREAVIVGDTDSVTAASFAPDGRSIVTSSLDGTARIYPARSLAPFGTLEAWADAEARVPLTKGQRDEFENLLRSSG